MYAGVYFHYSSKCYLGIPKQGFPGGFSAQKFPGPAFSLHAEPSPVDLWSLSDIYHIPAKSCLSQCIWKLVFRLPFSR